MTPGISLAEEARMGWCVRLAGVCALVLVTACGALSSAARSGTKTMVVLRFRGPANERMRAGVVDAAQRYYQLIPSSKYQRVKNLEVDIIVKGQVRPRGRSKLLLTVAVHDGKTGNILRSSQVLVSRQATAADVERALLKETGAPEAPAPKTEEPPPVYPEAPDPEEDTQAHLQPPPTDDKGFVVDNEMPALFAPRYR
jgi:hypothetical protein